MEQIIEKAAKERAEFMVDCFTNDDMPRNDKTMIEMVSEAFINGATWQSKQSPWIRIKDKLPDDNENIVILCEHGAIFNGSYSNDVWFCMDGYIHDTFKGNPIYTSMSSIPPLWKPIAWMPIPKFNEEQCSNEI